MKSKKLLVFVTFFAMQAMSGLLLAANQKPGKLTFPAKPVQSIKILLKDSTTNVYTFTVDGEELVKSQLDIGIPLDTIDSQAKQYPNAISLLAIAHQSENQSIIAAWNKRLSMQQPLTPKDNSADSK